jgi:hypothetical protein
METVEFTFEIRCVHSKEAIETTQEKILDLLRSNGFIVESNVEAPVGLSDDETMKLMQYT